MSGDWGGIALVAAGFLGLIAAAELWSRLGGARPESSRKLVHVGGGLLCLTLPWLVSSPWSVLVLAAASTAVLALGRRGGRLRGLHRVERRTLGSEYYPLAVFLAFLVSEGRAWLFVCGILVLALADAGAALVGTRHGRYRYSVEERDKSVEGSLAFLAVAFAAVTGPMLLMTGYAPALILVAALQVALLMTGLEAISLDGSDNVFVPVGVCVILSKIVSHSLAEAVYQCASLLVLAALVVWLVRRVRTFNAGGTIAFLLFVYAAWSMGSELWALPVLAGFLLYAGACVIVPRPAGEAPEVRVRLVFRAVLAPFMLLTIGNMFRIGPLFYVPFLGTCACVLAITLWNHVGGPTGGTALALPGRIAATAAVGSAAAAVVLALPLLLSPLLSGFAAAGVGATVALASAVNGTVQRGRSPADDPWGGLQIGLAFATGGLLLLLEGGCTG